MKNIGRSAGTSLVELSVGILISSIILSTAYKSHEYLSKSSERENQKAVIQRDIMTVIDKMSRDIRMAGIGLPGSGLQATLSDTADDKLQIFINDNGNKFSPTLNIGFNDTIIHAKRMTGVISGKWICITNSSIDTIYRKTTSVDITTNGTDTLYTIHLANIVGAGVFQATSTDIYFCSRTVYEINNSGSSASLTVQKNNLPIDVGQNLDTLNIVIKNVSGASLFTDFENAAAVSIFTGGHIGQGKSRTLISETTEINIRNRD